ncbi:hypothetical protein CYLTODRAFT_427220 [Cylindrobasidium torrendii FP15055 ss-10]|uniref:Uncharacterized protein n=1 Tax=Cylindrobasidium torrendii FP15055 ss-10 TaxID=1314674 RepID=A0A0D7AUH2_9AGAR|nr:hypothetical protein CYLTODRAFT_427220 [Cylindrobasidium torrendii FP15055 ss-10]
MKSELVVPKLELDAPKLGVEVHNGSLDSKISPTKKPLYSMEQEDTDISVHNSKPFPQPMSMPQTPPSAARKRKPSTEDGGSPSRKKQKAPEQAAPKPLPKAKWANNASACAWIDWCASQRVEQDPSFKHKKTYVIWSSVAMKHYDLSEPELGTLKYQEFENKHNPRLPGHSYKHAAVQELVYRRCAAQAGDEVAMREYNTGSTAERAMLARGREIWTQHISKRTTTPHTPYRR